jgi:dTDP-glucose 4,6-dehydratase
VKLLVTGAAGFIGSAYVRMLLAAGTPQAPEVSQVTVQDPLDPSGILSRVNGATDTRP